MYVYFWNACSKLKVFHKTQKWHTQLFGKICIVCVCQHTMHTLCTRSVFFFKKKVKPIIKNREQHRGTFMSVTLAWVLQTHSFIHVQGYAFIKISSIHSFSFTTSVMLRISSILLDRLDVVSIRKLFSCGNELLNRVIYDFLKMGGTNFTIHALCIMDHYAKRLFESESRTNHLLVVSPKRSKTFTSSNHTGRHVFSIENTNRIVLQCHPPKRHFSDFGDDKKDDYLTVPSYFTSQTTIGCSTPLTSSGVFDILEEEDIGIIDDELDCENSILHFYNNVDSPWKEDDSLNKTLPIDDEVRSQSYDKSFEDDCVIIFESSRNNASSKKRYNIYDADALYDEFYDTVDL